MAYRENKYPQEPPYQDQVVFFEGATLRNNPQSAERKAKICPVCNYPIHIRMVSLPCQHLFCYQCHQKSPFSCGVCGSLNSQAIRIDDKEILYSCDRYCHKVYSSSQQLQNHFKNHELLNHQ